MGETIHVLGETMWAKLVMGETRYIRIDYLNIEISSHFQNQY